MQKGKSHQNYSYQTTDYKIWKNAKIKARQMRTAPTKAEDALWNVIRNKKTGYKIRRQHSIDIFIVDFVCLEKKLVIEIDGEIHNDKEIVEYDKERTAILNLCGFEVIRFSNEEVLQNPYKVAKMIKEILESITSFEL